MNSLTQTNYEVIKQHLLTVYNLLAPTGTAQAAFAATGATMERDGLGHDEIVSSMLASLCDGVDYGNWGPSS